jgi:hypothetical protein
MFIATWGFAGKGSMSSAALREMAAKMLRPNMVPPAGFK